MRVKKRVDIDKNIRFMINTVKICLMSLDGINLIIIIDNDKIELKITSKKKSLIPNCKIA